MAFWNTESKRVLLTCRIGAGRVGAMRIGFAPKDTDGGPGGAASGPYYVWRRFIPKGLTGMPDAIENTSGAGLAALGNTITVTDFAAITPGAEIRVTTEGVLYVVIEGTDWVAETSNEITAENIAASLRAKQAPGPLFPLAGTITVGASVHVNARIWVHMWRPFKR